MQIERKNLQDCRTIVIKIGSSSLVYANGRPNYQQLEQLVRQMADLYNQGRRILLVSSGAIGIGASRLRLNEKPKSLPQKQAAAAVGQGILMQMYEKIFAEYDVPVGQILLTREDFSNRGRFLNARNTLMTLLELGVVPIINENDTIAVDEIRVGDNDNLSAQVASLIGADLLVLLSDIDGLYNADPRISEQAELIDQVSELTHEIEALAGGSGSTFGTGGMHTKLQAAHIAVNSGTAMVIAAADSHQILERIVKGEQVGTLFCPAEDKLMNRKRWIAFSSVTRGSVQVDKGAENAVRFRGKSLLPSGIINVNGQFAAGETVSVVDEKGEEFARGLVNYSSEELQLIKGQKSSKITQILGYNEYDEAIHRNNMVVEH